MLHGVIGEVVNTADCGSVMQGFDPLIAPQFKNKSLLLIVDFFYILGKFFQIF